MTDQTWIFGYGSLVWRPEFSYAEVRHGYIVGWARRFWQGSTDHRGVVGAPGRVVTLVERARAQTWGTAYRIAREEEAAVLRQLDHRERGGYVRHSVSVTLADGAVIQSLVYRATPTNANYLGAAPLAEIAAQVCRASGPSGHNRDYVLQLDESLRRMGVEDHHVAALAALVRCSHAS